MDGLPSAVESQHCEGEGAPKHPSSAAQANGRPETDLERWDRNFTELLQELRVVQTGVQILFGFLLTVPFSNRFAQASAFQVSVYVFTMLACAVAAALLIAPVSYHRQVFRQGRKAQVVVRSDRLARAGMLALLVAMSGVVFLVLDVLTGLGVACPLTAAVSCVYVLLWYVFPRIAPHDHDDGGE